MIAYITSIGEVTTELCMWSLERNGFEVKLIENGHSLAEKLETIYKDAEDSFIRVDADVVPNMNLTEKYITESAIDEQWWVQYRCFDWFQQDIMWGGVQYIKKEAIPYLRDNIEKYKRFERPETMLTRIESFYNPRRFVSHNRVMGIHGFKANDVKRVRETKERRNQEGYDWELAEKLGAL